MKDCALASKQIVGVSDGDEDHYENVTTGHQGSYSGIQCNVCHNSSNPTLLLLCDLCHSSSHTYCVGLGDTVPKNDWTCGKCTLLMLEHAEDDKDLDAPCTNAHGDGISIASSKAGQNSQAEFLVGHSTNQFAEVLGVRNGDSQIRAIRENWDKIREGSLSFSSFPVCEPGRTSSKLKSSCSTNIIPDPAAQDIKKAWKMMNAAKSIEKKKQTNNVHCSSNGSKHPLSDMRTPKESSSMRSMLLSSYHSTGDKGQDLKKFKRPQVCDAQKRNDKRKLHMFQQENASRVPNFERHPATYSIDSSKLSTSKKIQYSVHDRIDHENCVSFPHNNSLGTFSNNAIKNHGFPTCGSSGPVAKVPLPSSGNIIEVTNVETHLADGEAKVDSDAKTEIQSLVKLNLKLSSNKKKLDTNKFKEVARLATHSILAACGIGQPKSWVRPFPSPNCSHFEVEQVRRSTLLSSTCTECFLAFVKDVVNTIFLEKTTSK